MKHKNIYNICNKKKSTKSENSIGICLWKEEAWLLFSAPYFYMHMHLNRPMEWNAMIAFLKKTKKRGSLPKGNEGYSDYDIRKGIARFYSSQRKLKDIDYLREKNHSRWEKLKKLIEKDVKHVKKTGIAETMSLDYDNFSIVFTRKNFIKFREGCLSLKRFLKRKKFPGASIKF